MTTMIDALCLIHICKCYNECYINMLMLCSNFRITTTCVTAQKWVSTHTLGSQGVKYLRSAILAWRTWMPAPLPLLHSEKMGTSLNLNRACPPFLYLDSVFHMQNSILEGFEMAKSLLLLPTLFGALSSHWQICIVAQTMAERENALYWECAGKKGKINFLHLFPSQYWHWRGRVFYIFPSFFTLAMMTSLFLSNCDVTNSSLANKGGAYCLTLK